MTKGPIAHFCQMLRTELRPLTAIIMSGMLLTSVFAVEITFQVDMQFQDISPAGVHIAGSFQGWNPAVSGCEWVSDEIFAATFSLNPGDSHEYKFINGDTWGQDESVQRVLLSVQAVDTVLEPVFFDDWEDLGGEPVFVTFHLNTSTQRGWTAEQNQIVIRGSFNGWSGSDWMLENIGGDYWTFTSPEPLPPGNYEYKYVHLAVTGDEWELTDNRALAAAGLDDDIDLPLEYFGAYEPPFEVTEDIDVFFRVSTEVIGDYAGETMYLVGDFTNWEAEPVAMTDQFGDGDIWMTTVHFSDPAELEYIFWWGLGGWPNQLNYAVAVSEDTTIPLQYWWSGGDPQPVTRTVVFSVDMSPWLDESGLVSIPLFSPARGDQIQVRGGFNGWSDTPPETSVLERQAGTNVFSLPVSITNYEDNVILYNYYLDLSPESLALLEGTYGLQPGPNMGWELSPLNLGSNRHFTLGEAGDTDLELPVAGYQDLPAAGVIAAGEMIELTFQVDMTDAQFDGFVPGDPVQLVLKDGWFNYIQGFLDGTGQDSFWTASLLEDNVYQVVVPISGPAPWHQFYAWEFIPSESSSVQEGGGFGPGPCRMRYICPESGLWTDYVFPLDHWTHEPPLPVEDYSAALTCLGDCASPGDASGDGQLDILDVVTCVGYIFDLLQGLDVSCECDLDGDDEVNILDIVLLVDLILQPDEN